MRRARWRASGRSWKASSPRSDFSNGPSASQLWNHDSALFSRHPPTLLVRRICWAQAPQGIAWHEQDVPYNEHSTEGAE